MQETTVTLRHESGKVQTLPLDTPDRFEVYVIREIALSKGDKIRITRGGSDLHDKRLDNGQILIVETAPRTGDIHLRNENDNTHYLLSRDFLHMAHGVCNTSQAGQGKTVQQTFIFQPSATFPATNSKQVYVDFSRAKERTRLYTDNKIELLEYAKKLGDRSSALELFPIENDEREIRMRRERTQGDQIISPVIKERDYEPDREL